MTIYGLDMDQARENYRREVKTRREREADHPRRARECKERMIK
jgi:hypothetical protein